MFNSDRPGRRTSSRDNVTKPSAEIARQPPCGRLRTSNSHAAIDRRLPTDYPLGPRLKSGLRIQTALCKPAIVILLVAPVRWRFEAVA